MITLPNLTSLLLGLIALIIPIVNIIKHKKSNNKNINTSSILSISACATSLYFQILYNNYLVGIADCTAIMDIIGDLVFVSSVLLCLRIILNVITYILYRHKI